MKRVLDQPAYFRDTPRETSSLSGHVCGSGKCGLGTEEREVQ